MKLLRTLLALASATGILMAAALPAFADDGSTTNEPDIVADGRPAGYYIWHNENGWHLRTHGPDLDEHHFTARIHTDGTFRSVEGVTLEDRDYYVVADRGHALGINFHTYNGVDGMNFRLDGSSCIRFNLMLDGQPIPTDQIFLGKDKDNPDQNPFRHCRPDYEPEVVE